MSGAIDVFAAVQDGVSIHTLVVGDYGYYGYSTDPPITPGSVTPNTLRGKSFFTIENAFFVVNTLTVGLDGALPQTFFKRLKIQGAGSTVYEFDTRDAGFSISGGVATRWSWTWSTEPWSAADVGESKSVTFLY